MSEELQSQDLDVDVDNQPEIEANQDEEIGAELAPASEPEHEEKTDEAEDSSKVNQEAINKVISKKHFEAKEAERRALAAEQELERLRQAQAVVPEVPQKPDPYDDDYEYKMLKYEQAITEKAKYDANQQLLRQQQEQQAQQAQYEQQQRLNAQLQEYVERGKEQGMTVEEMTQAGQLVESYGIGVDIQHALLGDKDGALMVKHLAANPVMANQLANMNPFQAAMFIEQNVRPSAQALKPKSSTAKPPPKRVEKTANDTTGSYRYIGGAKFE